jgi:hypothetical protein
MATRTTKVPKTVPSQPVDKPREAPPAAVAAPVNPRPVTEDIRRRAYQRWEAAGRPPGDGIKFWLEAEQELLRVKKSVSQPNTPP